MPGHFCLSCHSWEKIFTRATGEFGICHNPAVKDKVGMDDDNKTNMEDDGVLYTESYFGCIYWRENAGGLFGTDKYADDVLKPKKKDDDEE